MKMIPMIAENRLSRYKKLLTSVWKDVGRDRVLFLVDLYTIAKDVY